MRRARVSELNDEVGGGGGRKRKREKEERVVL
jgi:hypothetical protein